MQPRFIGHLNWAKQDFTAPDLWQLEEPYGQLLANGWLVVCPPWKRTDGASIPKWLWPLFGHPFDTENKFWSVPHDMGYNGYARVIDTTRTIDDLQWLLWNPHTVPWAHIPLNELGRKWWDGVMLEGMEIMRERRWKKAGVYSAVRMFGGRSYLKD